MTLGDKLSKLRKENNYTQETKERLINSGFYDLATAYQSVHVNY